MRISYFICTVVLLYLCSCSHKAPSPITETAPLQASSSSVQLSSSSATKSVKQEQINCISNQDTNKVANHKQTKSDSLVEFSNVSNLKNFDPYTAFPALADSIFVNADSIFKTGNSDSAIAYLERFRIIKPLWTNWQNRADSMLAEYAKTQAERAAQYEPLAMQITNMNRAHTSYSLVAETADSLIALSPGDSLVRFANEQKRIAYINTLGKAFKEKETIWNLAQEQARFAEAKSMALELQMRYRDFEDTLKIKSLIASIQEQEQALDSTLKKYWEEHNPEQALAKADSLLEAKDFSETKNILNKLKGSPLRKEALEKYVILADTYCNIQRKQTSEKFGKAQKQNDSAKRRELLTEAIASLDKCLAEYPETTQRKKILDNRSFLEKELQR